MGTYEPAESRGLLCRRHMNCVSSEERLTALIYVRRKSRYMSKLWITRPEVRHFDVVALYHGLQLQLMVYMDAAVEFQKKRHPDKEVIPAGVFYYRIQDPLVDKTEDKEKAERAVLKQLKPDGIIPLGTEILKHLDHNTSGESLAVPVKYNKNGSVSGYSKVVAGEDFSAMMTHAKRQMEEARTKILNGEAGALPYKRGQESGCDYCPYRHVCGFDVKIPGYEYRDIGAMGKEEAMAAMRIEQSEAEQSGKGGN
mgnify:CR=1 FL=1